MWNLLRYLKLKIGGKNTFLGARGQGGRRRGSTPMSGAPLRVPTKLFFPRSYVEKRDSFGDNQITRIDWNTETLKQWNRETVKHWNFRISKKFFFARFFLDPKESESEKNKKVSFSKFDTFPPPASRTEAVFFQDLLGSSLWIIPQ